MPPLIRGCRIQTPGLDAPLPAAGASAPVTATAAYPAPSDRPGTVRSTDGVGAAIAGSRCRGPRCPGCRGPLPVAAAGGRCRCPLTGAADGGRGCRCRMAGAGWNISFCPAERVIEFQVMKLDNMIMAMTKTVTTECLIKSTIRHEDGKSHLLIQFPF